MKNHLRLCFTYLKNPVYLKNEKIQWPAFFKLFIVVYLLTILLDSVPVIFGHLLHLQGLPHYLKGLSRQKYWEGMLLVPVFEEILFRFLLKPTRKNIFWYVAILLFPLSANLIKGKYYFALIITSLLLLPLVLLLSKNFLKWAQKYYLKHFAFFFYLSCLVFGLAHATNFSPFSYKELLLAPLLALPQLFAAPVLGFVRMKYGVVYSVLFHFLLNLPAFL